MESANEPNPNDSLKTVEVNQKAYEILNKLAADDGISIARVIDAAINSLNFQVQLISAMEKELKQRGLYHKFKNKWKNKLDRDRREEIARAKVVRLSPETPQPTEIVPSDIAIP